MLVEAIPPAALGDLVEQLDAVRHDLGKYMAFETRFVGLDAPVSDLRRALAADLRATRRQRRGDGSEAVEAAWEVWRRLRPESLDGDPDIAVIDQGIADLAAADLDGDEDTVRRMAELALRVSEATRRLSSRARSAAAQAEEGAHG